MLPTEEAPISAWLKEADTRAQIALQRAKLGLTWLKEQGARNYNCYWSRIDADRIDISSFNRCPLAQASGAHSYAVAMKRIHGDEFSSEVAYHWAIGHGFNAPLFCERGYFGDLDFAWTYLIKREQVRQGQANLPRTSA